MMTSKTFSVKTRMCDGHGYAVARMCGGNWLTRTGCLGRREGKGAGNESEEKEEERKGEGPHGIRQQVRQLCLSIIQRVGLRLAHHGIRPLKRPSVTSLFSRCALAPGYSHKTRLVLTL